MSFEQDVQLRANEKAAGLMDTLGDLIGNNGSLSTPLTALGGAALGGMAGKGLGMGGLGIGLGAALGGALGGVGANAINSQNMYQNMNDAAMINGISAGLNANDQTDMMQNQAIAQTNDTVNQLVGIVGDMMQGGMAAGGMMPPADPSMMGGQPPMDQGAMMPPPPPSAPMTGQVDNNGLGMKQGSYNGFAQDVVNRTNQKLAGLLKTAEDTALDNTAYKDFLLGDKDDLGPSNVALRDFLVGDRDDLGPEATTTPAPASTEKNYGPLKADTINVPETTWFENLANSAPISKALDLAEATGVDRWRDSLSDFAGNIGTGLGNLVNSYDTDLADAADRESLMDSRLNAARLKNDQIRQRGYEGLKNTASNFMDSLGDQIGNGAELLGMLVGGADGLLDNQRAAHQRGYEGLKNRVMNYANTLSNGMSTARGLGDLAEGGLDIANSLNGIGNTLRNTYESMGRGANNMAAREAHQRGYEGLKNTASNFMDSLGDQIGNGAELLGMLVGGADGLLDNQREAREAHQRGYEGLKNRVMNYANTLSNGMSTARGLGDLAEGGLDIANSLNGIGNTLRNTYESMGRGANNMAVQERARIADIRDSLAHPPTEGDKAVQYAQDILSGMVSNAQDDIRNGIDSFNRADAAAGNWLRGKRDEFYDNAARDYRNIKEDVGNAIDAFNRYDAQLGNQLRSGRDLMLDQLSDMNDAAGPGAVGTWLGNLSTKLPSWLGGISGGGDYAPAPRRPISPSTGRIPSNKNYAYGG